MMTLSRRKELACMKSGAFLKLLKKVEEELIASGCGDHDADVIREARLRLQELYSYDGKVT